LPPPGAKYWTAVIPTAVAAPSSTNWKEDGRLRATIDQSASYALSLTEVQPARGRARRPAVLLRGVADSLDELGDAQIQVARLDATFRGAEPAEGPGASTRILEPVEDIREWPTRQRCFIPSRQVPIRAAWTLRSSNPHGCCRP
jgi:hypothetical protein